MKITKVKHFIISLKPLHQPPWLEPLSKMPHKSLAVCKTDHYDKNLKKKEPDVAHILPAAILIGLPVAAVGPPLATLFSTPSPSFPCFGPLGRKTQEGKTI